MSPWQGYVRTGCLHLTVEALLSRHADAVTARAGARGVVRALLAGPHGAFWAAQASLVGCDCVRHLLARMLRTLELPRILPLLCLLRHGESSGLHPCTLISMHACLPASVSAADVHCLV